MEIKGRIIAALPPRSGVSQKGTQWQVNEYVIEETGVQYPKKVAFEVFGDRIQQLNIQNGVEYTISFDIDAREYNGRWFNSVRAWKAVPVQATQSVAPAPQQEVFKDPFPPATAAPSSSAPVSTGADTEDDMDSLPF